MVKIQQAAKSLGQTVTAVNSSARALAAAQQSPALIILDLNCTGAQPLELISKLKSDPATSAIPLLAFVAHVDAASIQEARARGCDTVLARSAFSQNLPTILVAYFAESANPEAR